MKCFILALLVGCYSGPISFSPADNYSKNATQMALDEGNTLNELSGCKWFNPEGRTILISSPSSVTEDCGDSSSLGCYISYQAYQNEKIFIPDWDEAIGERLILLHEIGHALGLSHVLDPNSLMYYRFHVMKVEDARDELVRMVRKEGLTTQAGPCNSQNHETGKP